jgi:hypothetical protein
VARRTQATAALELLEEHGVEARVENAGSGHQKVLFEANGHRLMYVVACTPSDGRAHHNMLAGIRRLLRKAGVIR